MSRKTLSDARYSNGMEIRPYRESDQDAVVALWNECGLVRPWNDPVKDIRRKLRVQETCFSSDRLTAGW